ncbi:MAG TPA: DUF4173 domain-containing protein [Candidatus Limnocylindria bacterium]
MTGAAVTATGTEARTTRLIRRAGAICLAAIGVGLLAQLLFYDNGLGLNLPLGVAAILVAAWFVPARPTPWPPLRDAWLPAAAIGLAAYAAIRDDHSLIALDVMGSALLTAMALASFGGMAILLRPISGLAALAAGGTLFALSGAGSVLLTVRETMPWKHRTADLAVPGAVLRGLLLALPLVLLFVALFAAADAVFSQMITELFDWDLDLGTLPGRLTMAVIVAWVVGGLLVFVSIGREEERAEAVAGPGRIALGATEAVTLLVALDLLFALFVVLQATYLFGGRSTLEASGLTYAEYARRGFFELLAVAVVVGALVLGLEATVRRRSTTYLIALVVLVILTVVVLASAFLRLRLYQEAYGWSELRFYVVAAILWLAVGAIGAVACIVTNRAHWLPSGLLCLAVVFGLAVNLIGPARFVAEQNIARAQAAGPGEIGDHALDVWYLGQLGDDALGVIEAAYPWGLPSNARSEARQILAFRAAEIAADPHADDWQAWNLSRQRLAAELSEGGPLR